jgi:predicted DNA-binding protein YlxM (UPF0122 family)
MDYQNSDFAINKQSDGIAYRSVTGKIIIITKDRFLSENPKMTEADFESLKAFSDEDYRVRCNSDHTEARRGLPYCDSVECEEYADTSMEDKLIGKEQVSRLYEETDNCLTETQRRRFDLHCFQGYSIRQIADGENASFTSVEKCLNLAKKENKKIFAKLSLKGRTNAL